MNTLWDDNFRFDAVTESRKWKRASWLRLNATTREEQDAHLQKVVDQLAARRRELLRHKHALAVH